MFHWYSISRRYSHSLWVLGVIVPILVVVLFFFVLIQIHSIHKIGYWLLVAVVFVGVFFLAWIFITWFLPCLKSCTATRPARLASSTKISSVLFVASFSVVAAFVFYQVIRLSSGMTILKKSMIWSKYLISLLCILAIHRQMQTRLTMFFRSPRQGSDIDQKVCHSRLSSACSRAAVGRSDCMGKQSSFALKKI